MSEPIRFTAAKLCAQGLPAAAAAATTAVLAPFGVWVAAALTALVGAGAWAASMRRRSTLLPTRGRFISS